METFSYGTTYIWTYSSNISSNKGFRSENIHPRSAKKFSTHTIHTYAHGIQARRPQEMKFLFRRAGNWIFGFRRRISDTKKRKKKKKRRIVSGQHSRRITLQFLARLTFRCLYRVVQRHLPPPPPSLINLGNKEGSGDDSGAFNGVESVNYRAGGQLARSSSKLRPWQRTRSVVKSLLKIR